MGSQMFPFIGVDRTGAAGALQPPQNEILNPAGTRVQDYSYTTREVLKVQVYCNALLPKIFTPFT